MRIAAIIAGILFNTTLVAQTYNWTGFVTTTNSSTNTFVNGNMTAVVSAVAGGGQTAYSVGNTTVTGGTGECAGNPTGLYLEMSGASSAWGNSINVAITFATPVCGPVTFSIYEINYNVWNDGTSDWGLFHDQVTIGATDNTTAAVAPANIVIGGCATAGNVSTSGNNKIIRAGVYPGDNCECSAATVSIGSAGQQIKTINILYNNVNPPPAPIAGKYGICQWQYTILSPIAAAGPAPVTITPVIPFCGATTATLTASGGFSSYAWSTVAPGNITSPASQSTTVNGYSTYTVTATSGSCPPVTASYVFNAAVASALPAIGTLTGGTIYCAGGTATVSTNATGVNYSWSGPGIVSGAATATATVNSAGTYTLTTTNPINGCTNSGTVNVASSSLPAVTITLTCGGTSCGRYIFTSAPAVPGASYQWQVSSSPSTANPPTGFSNIAGATGTGFTGGNGGFCANPNVGARWVRLRITVPGCPAYYSTTSIFTNNTNPGCGLVVLPVELTYFKGICNSGSKIFNWETASENNNDYFTLEHSKNGIHFNPVAIIDGAGSSSFTTEYSESIVESDDEFKYYRLKQTDYNGEFVYSAIVALTCESEDFSGEISVYPNPVKDQLTIDFGEVDPDQMDFFITDITGRLIAVEVVYAGNSSLRTIDVSNYSTGIYFLNVLSKNSDSGLKSVKFIKTGED